MAASLLLKDLDTRILYRDQPTFWDKLDLYKEHEFVHISREFGKFAQVGYANVQGYITSRSYG